jgi:hypothetical protein
VKHAATARSSAMLQLLAHCVVKQAAATLPAYKTRGRQNAQASCLLSDKQQFENEMPSPIAKSEIF